MAKSRRKNPLLKINAEWQDPSTQPDKESEFKEGENSSEQIANLFKRKEHDGASNFHA